MKFLILVFALALAACANQPTQPGQPAPPNPVMKIIDNTICPLETDLTQQLGSWMVNNCGAPAGNAAVCGASLEAGLGAVNFCNTPVPQPAAQPQLHGLADVPTNVKTLGDLTKSQIDIGRAKVALLAPQALRPRGIIANVACPIFTNVGVGELSQLIPAACGCTHDLTNTVVVTAATSLCELLPF